MADRDRTVSHKDFTAVSVTAEQWLPIRDVSIAGLVPYLLRLRREGYTLVGLEQTRGAVDVNAFEFPRRTALVLGREREGIDADVLSVLDPGLEQILQEISGPKPGRLHNLRKDDPWNAY